MIDQEISREVARNLLKIEAVKLSPEEPFTWASGWKSPIYCDNRMSLSFPEVRTFIKTALIDGIREKYPEVEAIAGVATAGIPQGAIIAEEMGLPFIYVRSKAKGHGMTNLIEGKVVPGQKVVVIEDLVSTGGSSLKACADLRENDIEVLGMAAIFTYGFTIADINFSNAKVDLFTLSDYNILIEEALGAGIVDDSKIESLQDWRRDPANWKK